jgi:hypothetical protein
MWVSPGFLSVNIAKLNGMWVCHVCSVCFCWCYLIWFGCSDFDPLAFEEEDDETGATDDVASQGHAIFRVAYVPSRCPTAAKALLVHVDVAVQRNWCSLTT